MKDNKCEKENKDEKERRSVIRKNPVMRTGKWAISLTKNKLVASLMLLVQGILFIAFPMGEMHATVQIAAGVVILACAINILLHFLQKEKNFVTWFLTAVNVLFAAAATFFLFSPHTIEPYVRIIVGAVTALTGLINLIETMKIEKRKSWQFAAGVAASAVITGLGVTMLIASTAMVELVQQYGGTFLIFSALMNMWNMIRIKQTNKKRVDDREPSPAHTHAP